MCSRYLPAKTILFERDRSGVTYRIPALLYLPASGTLLAFAEERFTPNDADANLLVLRQGHLSRTHVEWGDMRAIQSAQLKDHRSMNPCPVYDHYTDTLFLFFIAIEGHVSESYQLITGNNLTRLCYVQSTDQGRSWNSLTDLTDPTIGQFIKEWATFGLGPGHGIQLRSGRLIIPAYTYHIDCKECFGKICKTSPHSFTFYSDDHGGSWQFGEFVPNLLTVECQMVSVDEENGTNILYCNARSPLSFRVQAVSTDDGGVFHCGQMIQKLVEPAHGCHGSVIGFPAPIFSPSERSQAIGASHFHRGLYHQSTQAKLGNLLQTPTWVVFSHPTSPTTRANLGVYLSTFPRDPDSWTEPWVINEGPSAYSDLAYIELPCSEAQQAGTPGVAFGCLYECGNKSTHEKIAFSIFTLRELIRNVSDVSKYSQSHSTSQSSTKNTCCKIV